MTKRKNILFIVSRLPVNLHTGDRLRVYNFIKQLTGRGHRVDVIGFTFSGDFTVSTDIERLCNRCIGVEKEGIEFKNPSRFKQLASFCSSFFHRYPFRVWQWHDEAFIEKTMQLIDEKNYDVIHFSEVVSGLVFDELIKTDHTAVFVFDLIDSVALSIDNSLNRSGMLRPFRMIEKKRLKKYEKSIIKRAGKTILISKRDKDYLEATAASIIPNGITVPKQKERERDIDLLFTGNMSAEANIDAAVWFSKKVMPKLASLKLYIVGANPGVEVEALASGNIAVTGFVSNMNEYYQRTKLFVCPIRLGAGQKNKVLEAMVNHAPVISTGEGNIGIEAPRNAIAIADNVKDFIGKIELLLEDKDKRKQQTQNAYKFVKNNYSWVKSVDLLERCYEKASGG